MQLKSLILFVLPVVLLSTSLNLKAQQVPESLVTRILDAPDFSSDTMESLSQSLKDLQLETQKLKSTVAGTEEESLDPVVNEPLRQIVVDSNFPATSLLQDTDDIYDRIELLKRIHENRANLPAHPNEKSENGRVTLDTPTDSQAAVPFDQPSVKRMMEFSNPEPELIESADSKKLQTLSADRVFPEPVDLFEMGISLFQTGNVTTALEAFAEVDRKNVTAAESIWLDFMIACANRRIGNEEDAEAIYRDIANLDESGVLTGPAQRWLKQIELRSKSSAAYEQIEMEIDTLLERALSHVKN